MSNQRYFCRILDFVDSMVESARPCSCNSLSSTLSPICSSKISLLLKAIVPHPFFGGVGRDFSRAVSSVIDRFGVDELSIHKMAAKHLNKSNHNGWSYFFIKKGDGFVNLDSLRYEYKKMC